MHITFFGAMVGCTLATWLLLLLWRAEPMGFDCRRALHLLECVVLSGVAGAFLLPRLLARGGLWSLGGVLGAALGAAMFLWIRRLPVAYLDLLTWIFPFGWAFLRLGCTVRREHPGIRTDSWLGVPFPDGRRYDLAALEMAACVVLACLFAVLGRKRRPPGYWVRWLAVFGLVRMLIGLARENPPRYFGLTADQVGGLALIAVASWAATRSRAE